MNKSSTKKFLIDGFPRNENNLQGWHKVMDGKADVKCVLFFECTEEVHTLPVQSICIFVENVQRSYLLLSLASLSRVYHYISSHTLYANSPRLSVSLLDKAPISWSSGWVTKALVCYTAVFLQHSSPQMAAENRTMFLSLG